MRFLDSWAEQAVWRALASIERGSLIVDAPGGVRRFGPDADAAAILQIHHPRFFRRVVSGGEMGLGEAYMDGDWSSPDLVGLVRLMLANRAVLDRTPSLATAGTSDRG